MTAGDAVDDRLREGAFLLVDKPRGPSSHQVTAWARDLLGVSVAGHAGTLDPNVSGLLWIGVGPALKLLPLVLEFPKRYVTSIVLHGPAPTKEVQRVLTEFTGPVYQNAARPFGGEARTAGPHHPSPRAPRNGRSAPPPRPHGRLGHVRPDPRRGRR